MTTSEIRSPLPTDIIRIVYQALLQNDCRGDKARWTILCTSKTVHDALVPLIWVDLVIKIDNLFKFVSIEGNRYNRLVRSLTLGIVRSREAPFLNDPELHVEICGRTERRRCRIGCTALASKQLQATLRQFALLVGKFQVLQVFSLHVNTYGRCAEDLFYFGNDFLSALVAALPATVRAVEIDTCGLDQASHTGFANGHLSHDPGKIKPLEACICRHFAQLSTRVESLRLNLRVVCKCLFVPSKTLKHFSLSLINDHQSHSVMCDQYAKWRKDSEWNYWMGRQHMHDGYAVSGYERVTKNLIEAVEPRIHASDGESAYPNLECFQIIDVKSRDGWSNTKCVSLMKHDLANSLSFAMPCYEVKSRLELPLGTKLYALRTHINDRTNKPYDIVSRFGELLEKFEGESWVQDDQGSRFPAYDPSMWRSPQRLWSNPQIFSPDEIGASSMVWDIESSANRISLYPTTKNLGEVTCYYVPQNQASASWRPMSTT